MSVFTVIQMPLFPFTSSSKSRLFVVLVLCILSFVAFGSPIAAATDAGGIILPDYHHIDITMANGGSYYIKFDGGGLNALHITSSMSEPYGQITSTESSSGVFYLSDTGGRGFNDDLILMVAVQGTTVPDDYSIHIKASGYTWAPTPMVNQNPSMNEITYHPVTIDETFTKQDFIYGPQNWKPSNSPPYPIVVDQNMNDPAQTFRFMFVDLKAGTLGQNSNLSGLIDSGMVKVEYAITNPAGLTVFNTYAWCNQSNQGKGISWTNALTYTVGNGGKTTGASGYSVKGPASGTSGDVAPGGAGQGGNTVSVENTKQTTEKSGFEGLALTSLKPFSFNGSAVIRATDSPKKNLTPGETIEYTLDPAVPPGSPVTAARFWVYITGSQVTPTGTGTDPDLSVICNDLPVAPAAIYTDKAGTSTAPRSATLAYDVKSALREGGTGHLKISLKGPPDSKCTVIGGSLLVIATNDSMPSSTIWIDEGCDIVSADPGKNIRVDDPVTEASFVGPVEQDGTTGTLYYIITPSVSAGPPEEKTTFNLGELLPSNVTGPIAVRTINITSFLAGSGNRATIGSVANGITGVFLENRNVILVVTRNIGTGVKQEQPPGAPSVPPVIHPTLMVITPKSTYSGVIPGPAPATEPGPRYLLPGPFRPVEDLFFSVFRTFALPGSDEAGKPGSSIKDNVQTPPAVQNSQVANLTVITDPPGATVIIDGVPTEGIAPVMFIALPLGDHMVTVKSDGYGSSGSLIHLTQDQLVTLKPGAPAPGQVPKGTNGSSPPPDVTLNAVNSTRSDQMQSVTGSLSDSTFGGVYVVSSPDQAHIWIDGGETSHLTPAVVYNLQRGVHSISVSKEGVSYSPANQQAEVFPDALTTVAFDTNQIASRMIAIGSEDFNGDTATVNGKGPAFTIPARVPLNGAGAYITIRHGDSYRTFTISEFLNDGETWTIKDDREPLGNVRVVSNPAGADILLDGFFTGQVTPAIVKNVSNGQHVVAVSKPGLLPDEQYFSVVADPTRDVDASVDLRLLPYMFGTLRVVSTPPGADIFIDDIYTREKTPYNFTFTTVGRYTVKLTLGDQTREFDAEVYPGEVREYAIDFVKETIDNKRSKIQG